MSRMLDKENPEWTEGDFKKAKPVSEILPKLARKMRQKAHTKIQTTVRLDQDVIHFFKSTGRGWQTKLNNALKEWVFEHRK